MLSTLIEHSLFFFGIIGSVGAAISGALFAAEKRMDILGFILIGAVTGLGGGSFRDLLLGLTPVFWIREPLFLYLCVGASALAYFWVQRLQQRDAWILWLDALGLAAFTVIGTQAGWVATGNAFVAIAMGVMTATFGGIIRDSLCADTLTLMRPELYITCACFGAAVAAAILPLDKDYAMIFGFLAAMGLRSGAIIFGWVLPHFSPITDKPITADQPTVADPDATAPPRSP